MIITLFSTQRTELMSYVREYSDTWNALCDAVTIPPRYLPLPDITYAVTCDDAGAQVLLYTAMKHCPGAVDAIKSGMLAARTLLQ